MAEIFYTYMWLREDGTPYYVGKGHGKRAYRRGSPPLERIITQEWPCEADAFEAEKFLIFYYGRKDVGTGMLINITDGGEGFVGGRHSWHARKLMTENRTGRPIHSLEERAKRSAAMMGKRIALGVQRTPEQRERYRQSKLGANNPAFGKTRREFLKMSRREVL